MAETDVFLKIVEHRRTYYALENKSTIPDSRIEELVTATIKHLPSAFNSQTCRLVVVLNHEHTKLWDMIADVHQSILPPEKFESLKGRFDGFRGAYGTILFYEDTDKLREFQDKFKMYEDKFPQWSHHSSGMHQFVLWTGLEAEGFGCNLQHYNPVIDSKLQSVYDVPVGWNLQSQLVFGKPTGGPARSSKQFDPVEDRVKYFGKS